MDHLFDGLTIAGALSQIRQRKLTIVDMLQHYIGAIQHWEARIQAWQGLALESAQQQAQVLDAGGEGRHQPLYGIPVGIKDIFATADLPTAWGTPIYAGRYRSPEAAVVSQLKAAGAIILGKTVTTELATAAAGPTRNPHHPAHTPGGSSSGSAAAVAAGMVPIAMGSQTMGSVIRPAAYCGIFGFKPSFGLISRAGMMPVCEDLDQVGFFARHIEDLQTVFEVLAPLSGVRSPVSRSEQPKLAWVPTPDWPEVAPQLQTRLHEAIAILQQAGLVIEAVDLPPGFDQYWATTQTLCAYGLYQHHGDLLACHGENCSPLLRTWFERGRQVSPEAYRAALGRGQAYRAGLNDIFANYDGIFTPAITDSAPPGLVDTGSPRFCALWTLCGTPALTLPLGMTPAGLPLAGQLVGPWGQDQALLQVATLCWQHLQSAWGPLPVPRAPGGVST